MVICSLWNSKQDRLCPNPATADAIEREGGYKLPVCSGHALNIGKAIANVPSSPFAERFTHLEPIKRQKP